uniref:Odorant receptor n=1 Tax=Dendrolimus punctatus TaxID=238572 RepID=A0A2K8GKR3_9NEOP|nr:Odorant Receptor 8 [Dendrolimus punctatus]
MGMPNFWIEDLLPKKYEKLYNIYNIVNNGLIFIFIGAELAGFYTQTNLTEKQKSEQLLYGLSHPILFTFYLVMTSHKHKGKDVMYDLVVELKKVYNDLDVEQQMISKLKSTLTALISFCAMSVVFYTCDAILLVIRTGTTFNVLILVWPDLDDRSNMAYLVRFVFYIFWWIFCSRVFAMYILIISVLACLSHQYKNLVGYFYGISEIFEEKINQEEKEKKYEEAFRVGIKLHVDTLRCTEDCRTICGGVFSGQIIFNITLLVVLLSQLVSTERTIMNLFAAGITATAILVSTAFFMWNAGDVTIEASNLATAMYFSGWYNCMGRSSVRIRKMVILSMMIAQKPVLMKGLGVIVLSYESYVSIVKSSYSAFSVIY